MLPPVTIESVEPFFTTDRKPGLRVSAAEMQGRSLTGTLRVRLEGIPESEKTLDLQLTANEKRSFETICDNLNVVPIQAYNAEVTVTTKSGYSVTTKIPVNFMRTDKWTITPKIDGNLADWKQIAPIPLEGRPWVVRSPEHYRGNDDLAATLRFAWDHQALYLAAEVTDDVYFQDQTGFHTWMGDCIQLDLDLDPRKEDRRTGNELADKANRHRVSEINLALTAKGPEAFRTVTFDDQKFPMTQLTPTDLPLAVTRHNNRLTYETAIPWKTLGADGPPKDGLIGFALTINDKDDANQVDPSALGAFQLKDTRKFGRMFLAEPKK